MGHALLCDDGFFTFAHFPDILPKFTKKYHVDITLHAEE